MQLGGGTFLAVQHVFLALPNQLFITALSTLASHITFLTMDNLSQTLSDKLSITKKDTSPPSPVAAPDGPSATSVKKHKPDPASIPSIAPAQAEIWCHQFPSNRKMMVGTITATSPLPTVGTTKLTYDTHAHIVEQFLVYANVSTLLAFRATCRKLRDRADKLFVSHIELHMSGLDLVFETPSKRVIKGQRIPAFYRRARRHIRLDIRPAPEQLALLAANRFDHRITNFAIHHTEAEWFTDFLKNIKALDFHGSCLMTIVPGLPPRNGPHPLGEVAVKSAKIPQLRFYPDGSNSCQFATAVPFQAEDVVYVPNLHLLDSMLDGSWLFYPSWVPECTRVEHHLLMRVDQKYNVSVDKVRPFVYPPSVKEVTLILGVVGQLSDPAKSNVLSLAADDNRIVSELTVLTAVQRACGLLQPGITFHLYGFDNIKLRCPDTILPPDRVPNEIMLYFVRLQAAMEKGEG